MTKASTKKGMAGKLLAAGCSLALAASLTPAAALTALAANTVTAGTVSVSVTQGSASVMAAASVDMKDLIAKKKIMPVDGEQDTLYFMPDTNNNDVEGKWGAIAAGYDNATKVVPFDQIFSNAKTNGSVASSFWQPGTKLVVNGIELVAGGDTSLTLTYEQVQAATQYYPAANYQGPKGASQTVTPGIALSGGYLQFPGDDPNVTASGLVGSIKSNPTLIDNVLSIGLSSSNYGLSNKAPLMKVSDLEIQLPAQQYAKVPRVYGENWNDTMNAVVNKCNYTKANGEEFVVASSNNYQDALTASGLAGALQCPLLLTDKDELTQQTADQISALAANTGAKVYVIGGPLAISESVVGDIAALTAIKGKESIVRLAGETAADTSLAVFKKMKDLTFATAKAVVTTSIAFQDAMSISPYTYARGIPVVLTGEGNTLGADTLAALEGATNVNDALILGGNLAVSSSVEDQLYGAGFTTVKRIGEETCWETSNAIAEYLTNAANGVLPSTPAAPAKAVVATGDNYLDALVASQYCGATTQALLLVGNGQGGDYCVTNYITDNKSTLKTAAKDNVTIIGGPQAVSNAFAAQINKILA